MDPAIILAALPHPDISSPLARGVRYQHHFVVDLISDGRRLWHALSDEGQAVLVTIKREVADGKDAAAAQLAKAQAAEVQKLQAQKPPQEQGQEAFPANVPMTLDQLKAMALSLEAEIVRVTGVQTQPATLATSVDPAGAIAGFDPTSTMPGPNAAGGFVMTTEQKEAIEADVDAAAKGQ